MPETNISATAVSNMTDKVSNFSVATISTDAATGAKETGWMITKATQYRGYYKKIPELKKAIDAYATWVLGKGYTADPETTVILDHIKGWGEDTFGSILWNMIVSKKVHGDAFAEIIRDSDSGELLNIKPLDSGNIKTIANAKGIVERYEQMGKNPQGQAEIVHKFKPSEILHLCNDRIEDEIHGISVIEACENVILMRNEAMTDWRIVLHRNVNPLKLIYVDTDDTAKIDELQKKYEKAINLKEVLFVPLGTLKVEVPTVQLQDSLSWIKYCENFFYQAVGIPKVILGGSEEFTEASSKISYLTYEQIYTREVVDLEADLWNQMGIRIKFVKPASLKNEMLTDESKDNGQMGFQPGDTTAGVGQ